MSCRQGILYVIMSVIVLLYVCFLCFIAPILHCKVKLYVYSRN